MELNFSESGVCQVHLECFSIKPVMPVMVFNVSMELSAGVIQFNNARYSPWNKDAGK